MKTVTRFAVASAAVVAAAPAALAQSAGNFNATIDEMQCVINPDTGALESGISGTMLTTTIETPNGQGTALLITPSLATGLFTDTQTVMSKQNSGTTGAVQVKVTLDGKPVPPLTSDHPAITYDSRFQLLTHNVFNGLSNTSICSFTTTTTTSLSTVGSVTSTITATITIGSTSCSIDLVLSTLNAHSFNFVAPSPGGGLHTVEVDWAFVCGSPGHSLAASNCSTTFAANTAAACVGPGDVTVLQVKNFHKDGTISIIGP